MRLLPGLMVLILTQPAIAERCDVEPFLLGDDTLLPMPGMRDGQLIFEDAAICRALETLVPQQIAQSTFWLHEVRGAPPTTIVPLGGGMVAPQSMMGCRTHGDESTILFKNGRLLLLESINDAAADHSWRLPSATGGHRQGSFVHDLLPPGCWPAYAQAVERALFEPASTVTDWLVDAAYQPDTCASDSFLPALRGLLNRTLIERFEATLMWAPMGECFLRGSQMFPDRVSFSLDCPDDPGRIVVAVRPHLIEAFVGANSGMTADATIHPMDESCLSAWDRWRAQARPR